VLTDRVELVVAGSPGGLRATSLVDLEGTRETAAVDEAKQRVTGDTIAKVLFTSGSTGRPKGVINTQRMLCSNQEMIRSVLDVPRRRAAGHLRLVAVESHCGR
jgi:feruloyl-CoA synthase